MNDGRIPAGSTRPNPNSRLKAGQPLRALPQDQLVQAVLHPHQLAGRETIRQLLTALDTATDLRDYFELQVELFQHIHRVETHRAASSRALKRLRKGGQLQAEAPKLLTNGDPNDSGTWLFEGLVSERLARQLRTVGDGLAWQSLGYDRRLILALAGNERPGPIVDKVGLKAEIAEVNEHSSQGRFALMHDLTNCLRISDLSVIGTGPEIALREVKTSGRTPAAQRDRAQTAVNAVTSGGQLPGRIPGSSLVVLGTEFRTDLGLVSDAIDLARQRGYQGITVGEGRAVFVASVLDMDRLYGNTAEQAVKDMAQSKSATFRRAGIDKATHHQIANSGDTAGRSALTAPVSIFPLDVDDRTDLICDMVTVEVTASVDALVQQLESRGLEAEVLYPPHTQMVPPASDVLRLRFGSRFLTVHASSMNQMLFELLKPSAWAEGIFELLASEDAPTHPELVFSNEPRSWSQRDRVRKRAR